MLRRLLHEIWRDPQLARHLLQGGKGQTLRRLLQRVRRASPPAITIGKQGSSGDTGRLFCSQPFTRFEVLGGGQRGDVVFCCQSWVTTSIGNIAEHSVEEVWNGKTAKAF